MLIRLEQQNAKPLVKWKDLLSGQEYWNGVPDLPPGDLPNPGIEPRSPALQADSLPSEPPGKPWLVLGAASGTRGSKELICSWGKDPR